MEIAPLCLSEDMCGVQCGIVNKAKNAHGVQIGVYNEAEAGCCLQIGAVNCLSGRPLEYLPVLNFRFD